MLVIEVFNIYYVTGKSYLLRPGNEQILTAVKSAPKNPCSTPDQNVSGIIIS